MRKIYLLFLFTSLQSLAQPFSKEEIARWEKQAKQVSIIRDNWGIPHIYGKEDADAVFGLLYAQCEDDFSRVELNYIEKLGRMAEIKGEAELKNDLLIRMIIDTADAITDYNNSAPWLKKLLDAHADGINYYIYKHPKAKPALLHHFQPWYQLLWTDGSIGAINTAGITAEEIEKFYLGMTTSGSLNTIKEDILTGSNGFAFAPSVTESGNSILYINPHVTFYFRPEVHMVSEEGLNVYGAVTWGQFFIYQGFNEHCGWMHTSSYTDIADTYVEQIHENNKEEWTYEYNGDKKPVTVKKIQLRYLKENKLQTKTVTALYTHHGPVMAKRYGQFLSMKANNRSMNGLIQSWQRTNAKSFDDYKRVMGILANTSNNTVYADAEGNIAYWHGNFLPVRDTTHDWSQSVDGSVSATEWKGLHTVEKSVHIYNPANGWIQNCNSTPFTAAGSNSPLKKNYPKYMAPDGENFRGLNAVKVLSGEKKYSIDKVIAAGYDTYMTFFDFAVPALAAAFEKNIKPADSLYKLLLEPVTQLKKWDRRSAESSVPTTIGIEWAERLWPAIMATKTGDDYDMDRVQKTKLFFANATADELLKPLAVTIADLQKRSGHWQVAWGEVNRFQRISGDIDLKYDDTKTSVPVGFASATWGMIPCYASQYYPGTKKRYGYNGNSFICAVEFGKKVKAKSLLTGGESGHPASKHFNDQVDMYVKGQFKDVLFYKEDVEKHIEKKYHPGEEEK